MIFVDTNIVSETMRLTPNAKVVRWLTEHDAEIALSTIVISEIAFGIEQIRLDQRSKRLETGLIAWRKRFANRIFSFDEESALVYGRIMGAARQSGHAMTAPDGMIAAIALRHNAQLATRNVADFGITGLSLINPFA